MDVFSWPVWACDISVFDWEYDDQESCFLLEGEVEVLSNIETVKFGVGNFVVFPKGLKCNWEVHSSIKKYYTFK